MTAASAALKPAPDAGQEREARQALTALTERLLDSRVALAGRLSAAKARQEWLAAIIADHPDVVLHHAVTTKQRGRVPDDAKDYLEEAATVEGELEVLYEDGPDSARVRYFLRPSDDRLELHFAADAPALQTGDRVRVSGVRVMQAMALESATHSVQALAFAPSVTFGPQSTAVIMVTFTDSPSVSAFTAANVRNIVFGDAANSVSSFFREASYGQTWLTGDVYGPYPIPISRANCPYGSAGSYGEQFAKAEVGVSKMATYKRFVYMFPPSPCGWAGLATVGGSPSKAWINGRVDASVVAHEMGHNFGLYHSKQLVCTGVSVGPSCPVAEYGDPFDVMGFAQLGHFNAIQKDLLGWLNYGVSPPITTVQTSGTYAIAPYETVGGDPKALKVRTPSGDWYYVEYRQPIGFDAPLVSGNSNVTNGVIVHLMRGQSGSGVYLLDMTPVTPDPMRPALEVGDSFFDAASGIGIAPVWVDGNAAGVNVTVGASICTRKNPTLLVSPAQQQGTNGATLSYTVWVTNNDTGCAAASFTFQVTVPSGWSASAPATTSPIDGGKTVSFVLKVTSPASATTGTYSLEPKIVNMSATGHFATVPATYSVQASGTVCVPKSPTMTASPAQQPGTAGATISYTLSVTNNNTGCADASFTQQVTFPSGWSASAPSMTVVVTSR